MNLLTVNICQTSEMILAVNIYMSIEIQVWYTQIRLVAFLDTKLIFDTTQTGYPTSYLSDWYWISTW